VKLGCQRSDFAVLVESVHTSANREHRHDECSYRPCLAVHRKLPVNGLNNDSAATAQVLAQAVTGKPLPHVTHISISGYDKRSAPAGIIAARTREGLLHMLILTRRIGETVTIGQDITVTVLGIKGQQVRVGIGAPKDVPVHREEIYERIKGETDSRA